MIAIGIDVYPETSILGYFENIEGIEGECLLDTTQDEEDNFDVQCEIKLLRGKNWREFQKKLTNTTIENESRGYFIYFIDAQQHIKLSYYFYNLEITKVQNLENDSFDLEIICNLHKASKGVLEVCNMRLNRQLTEFNLWKNLESEKKQGWLEVALHFHTPSIDRENLKVEINGDLIDDTDSFYCVIGEAINGPGGYFGRNLDALNDCFRRDFGVKLPFTLHWKNHSTSKENLKEYFNQILDVFKANNVQIELN